MKSQGGLSLVTGSGTINNSGVISSSNGDINISAAQPQTDIAINASNGSFQALNGAINVNGRDASYAGSGNLSLAGGNYLSTAMNLNSGLGNVTTNVNSISGLLGINANAAHTTVATGALNLGTMNLKGDPTFYNTDGNITIGGNISVGEALSLVASGNILSSGNYSITANNGTAGAQINLVAGADITTSSSTSSPVVGGGSGTAATAPITITGPSSTGGDVSFSGQNMTISSAQSPATAPVATLTWLHSLILQAPAAGTFAVLGNLYQHGRHRIRRQWKRFDIGRGSERSCCY